MAPIPAAASPASPTPAPPTMEPAPSFVSCRAAIARRFQVSPAWAVPWTAGPADRSPYSDCHPWWDGSPPLARPQPPSACGDARGGWAGISIAMGAYAWALSPDGLTMARCNVTCTVQRVDDGRILVRSGGGGYPLDGTPASTASPNVALFRQYGLSAKSGPWPVADVMLDWSLAPRGAAVTYHLRDRESATTLAIGRFVSRDEYVFPHEPFLSDNGRTLLLIGELRPQGQGVEYEDAAVDLPAAIALLYVDAAASAPGDAKLHARAQAACDAVGAP